MTYQQADEKLRNTKGKWKNQRRKVANNTYLERHDDHIGLRLHNTTIIRWYPNGRTKLTSGGHRTATTQVRLRAFIPGLPLFTWRDLGWCIYDDIDGRGWGPALRWVDGMEFRQDGDTRTYNGHAAGYRTWDTIMDLAEDNRRSTCLWPGVVEECTPEGTARAIYERLCDELEVPRAVPRFARRDLDLHAIMTRWSRAMCAMRKAAEAA